MGQDFLGHDLILGGARSGKSGFGEKLALAQAKNPAYIATAQAHDPAHDPQKHDLEMRQRIARHRASRSRRFVTIEEPLELGEALMDAAISHDVILVDCLTLWLSNLMAAPEREVKTGVLNLIETLNLLDQSKVILISNEVGQGIVPDNALARRFRDCAGLMHQDLAKVCKNVILVTAGLPLALKGEVLAL